MKNETEDRKSAAEDAVDSARTTKPPEHLYYPQLPFSESVAYFLLYFGIVLYSVSLVFRVSSANRDRFDDEGNLEEGWKILGYRLKDNTDSQWILMTKFMWETYVLGFTGHFITARICDTFFTAQRYKVLGLYGMIFTVYFFGIHGLLFMLTHFVIQYAAARVTKNVWVCWIAGVLLCYSLKDSVASEGSHMEMVFSMLVGPYYNDDDKADFLVYTTAWCNLRYIAFSLEYVWADRDSKKESYSTDKNRGRDKSEPLDERKIDENLRRRNPAGIAKIDSQGESGIKRKGPTAASSLTFTDLLAYQFYYPLMYGGPIVPYNKFASEMNKPPIKWTFQEAAKFAFGLCRFAFWIAFLDFSLHFYYLPSLSSEADILQNMSSFFPAFGLGVAQVGFFYIKHVIAYGLPSHIASSDNFNAPKGPHCVYSRHRLTDMWKTFDEGLHQWLLRYIYFPLGGSKVGLFQIPFNSFLPFLFTAVWHDGDREYIHWAMLCWMGVLAEALALSFYRSKHIKELRNGYLTPAWDRRIRAAFSSIMFGSTLTINVYFQSGMEVGDAYWDKFYHSSFLITFLFHFTYYTGVQCCMDLHRWRITTS